MAQRPRPGRLYDAREAERIQRDLLATPAPAIRMGVSGGERRPPVVRAPDLAAIAALGVAPAVGSRCDRGAIAVRIECGSAVESEHTITSAAAEQPDWRSTAVPNATPVPCAELPRRVRELKYRRPRDYRFVTTSITPLGWPEPHFSWDSDALK